MVSACINKISDFPSPPPSSSWLSPRISSLRRDLLDQEPTTNIEPPQRAKLPSNHSGFGFGFVNRDLGKEMGDFEFPLEEEDPVKMLLADELFSDGKLVPLHIHRTVSESVSSKSNTNVRSPTETMESITTTTTTTVKSSSSNQLLHHQDSTSSSSTAAADLYLFSPKAPRCSSRWRELLGLKRQQQNKQDQQKKNPNSSSTTSRSLKYFLHRNSNIKSDSLPLLQDIDSSSAAESIISRLSLSSSSSSSSSSSGEDVPRISLDSDNINNNNNNKISNLNNNRNHRNLLSMKVKLDNKKSTIMTSRSWSTSGRSCCHLTTVRVGRTSVRSASSIPSSRGVSVDSPRMNSSGKIVFQSLERSSSSPSSFNGGPPASNRLKSRGIGMERSYSANLVRVSPVLNVPVCSLKSGSVFGFGQLFSCPQKRDGGSSTSTRTHAKKNHHHHKTATGIGGGGNGG